MLRRFINRYEFRRFSNTSFRTNLEKPKPSAPPAETVRPPAGSSAGVVGMEFTPNSFEKFILVWSGRYKSASDIPPKIGFDTLHKAQSKFRIRMANVMMVLTLVLCGVYAYKGKQSLKAGDTIHTREMEKDRKILEGRKS